MSQRLTIRSEYRPVPAVAGMMEKVRIIEGETRNAGTISNFGGIPIRNAADQAIADTHKEDIDVGPNYAKPLVIGGAADLSKEKAVAHCPLT